jgi:MYXO-CTERM domain-containing protein
VLAGGATMGNPSLTGFGTALGTADSGLNGAPASTDAYLAPFTQVNGAGDNTIMTYAGATGSFTFEAIVRLDVDLTQTFAGTARGTAPMHIFGGEQDGTGGGVRAWQLRIDPIGFNPNADGVTTALTTPALEFINVNNAVAPVQNRVVLLPTTGSNAVVSGQWYHLAVSYNGTEASPSNLSIYWTLADPSRTAADLLVQRQLDTDLPLAGTGVDFAVGNIGRTAPNGNFLGLIDEVRISSVARGPNEFIFQVPEPGSAVLAIIALGGLVGRRTRRRIE